MNHLARYAARIAAGVAVLVVMLGPVVAVAAAAGNPFPADLFDRIGGRNVDDATIVKLLSLCFYVCWAWFCLPALRQLVPAGYRKAPTHSARRRTAARTVAAPTPTPTGVTGPTRGPRAALAHLARFAVSGAVVVSSLTSSAGVAAADPAVAPVPAVATAVTVGFAESAHVAGSPAAATIDAGTVVARHRDTPFAIAQRLFPPDQLDAARNEILELNVGRPLPDGSSYRGGGFPAGWAVIVPATSPHAVPETGVPSPADPVPAAGYVVGDGESYWSISEAHLPVELGRAPTAQEVLARTEAAIAYNAARLGYDDPTMLHTGDIVYVDAASLSIGAPAADGSTVAAPAGGHVVGDGESYWSISKAHLPVELGRAPTAQEVLARTEAAIAYNGARLGYDDPTMLHIGDIVFVDAASLSIGATSPAPAPSAAPPPTPAAPSATPAEPVPVAADDSVSAPATPGPVDAAPPPAAPDVGDVVDVPVTASTSAERSSTAAAPVTTALPPPTGPRVVEEITVDQDDMLSSRWLFGGIAVTGLGLVGAWKTVKQMRQRRRRWLGVALSPDVGTAPTERERAAQLDVDWLRRFVDPARPATSAACAVVLGETPEIRFRVPAPTPPAGWQLEGDRWRRDATHPLTAMAVLSPALVTIGHGTDAAVSEVVLDLLTAGTVSVTGDRAAVERLMCSMLWELASDPLDDGIELRVVGLTSAAAQHAPNAGRLVSLNEAITAARAPHSAVGQVFLVDPFTDETADGNLRDLVEACSPGSGRAVVVAGPCEHPVEEISVPSQHRAMWDDLTLVPPQLPESVDVELGRMLDSIEIGRRHVPASALTVMPDPQAEAVALRATTVIEPDEDEPPATGDGFDSFTDGGDGTGVIAAEPAGVDIAAAASAASGPDPVVVAAPVEAPQVVLSVCGREVAVHGHPVPQAAAALFVLAAAGREMRASELAELTGYAPKSLSTVFTASHQLVIRDAGTLRLSERVWTDHGWASRCVAQLANAMRSDADSTDTRRWTLATIDALRALEHGPFAVLPAGRERTRSNGSAWGWVDDFPADVPARSAAETDVAEAALALSELWLAAPATHAVVRAEDLIAELCRLAATVPFAHVGRQLRDSMWVAGAECLLTAAARVAAGDETLLARVQQTARALAAREQLEASNALADELGL